MSHNLVENMLSFSKSSLFSQDKVVCPSSVVNTHSGDYHLTPPHLNKLHILLTVWTSDWVLNDGAVELYQRVFFNNLSALWRFLLR